MYSEQYEASSKEYELKICCGECEFEWQNM